VFPAISIPAGFSNGNAVGFTIDFANTLMNRRFYQAALCFEKALIHKETNL